MSDRVDVVVVGGGQAGLAVSRELAEAGVAHVVLEKGKVGQTWRGRWDSFCLVTPNWTLQLPGHPYDQRDPDGFMPRDGVVAYLERYAARCESPVQEGVRVTALQPGRDGRFLLETSAGEIQAKTVVLSAGAYQRPYRPAGAATLPADLLQIDVEGYRNPADLPRGAVLVVGSGQSGCQIAEEIHRAGRDVFLACGRAPWVPRQARRPRHPLVACRDRLSGRARWLVARARALAWPPTRRQRGTAGATTCTTGRCGAWASPCSAISWAPTVVAPDSRRISTKALLGAMGARRGSWTSCESWRPNAVCRRRTSPSRGRSTRTHSRSWT